MTQPYLVLCFLLVLLPYSFGASLRREISDEGVMLKSNSNFDPIPFDSPAGEEILLFPNTDLTSFFKLMEYFVTQESQSYCGIASATMVLNALGDKVTRPVDPVYYPHFFFTQNMFRNHKCVSQYVHGVEFIGLTLQKLYEAISCFTEVEIHYYSEDTEELKETIMKAIDSEKFVISNVNRKDLDQEGGGHFSPLGAYSIDEDNLVRFLFLDVARYKYIPYWFDADEIVLAMKAIDYASQKSRGFLIVG